MTKHLVTQSVVRYEKTYAETLLNEQNIDLCILLFDKIRRMKIMQLSLIYQRISIEEIMLTCGIDSVDLAHETLQNMQRRKEVEILYDEEDGMITFLEENESMDEYQSDLEEGFESEDDEVEEEEEEEAHSC